MGFFDFLKSKADLGDYVEGVSRARLEDAVGTGSVNAIRALLASIKTMQFASIGVALNYIVTVTGGLNITKFINEFSIYEQILYILGILALTGVLAKVAEHFVRFSVTTTGFSFSIEPGVIVRQYIYKASTKVYMTIWAVFSWALYLWYFFSGIQGIQKVLIPNGNTSLGISQTLMISLFLIVALIIYPASRVKIQSNEELFEALLALVTVREVDARLKLRQKVYNTIGDQLTALVQTEIATKGPGSIDEILSHFTVIGPNHDYANLHKSLGLPALTQSTRVSKGTIGGIPAYAVSDPKYPTVIHPASNQE